MPDSPQLPPAPTGHKIIHSSNTPYADSEDTTPHTATHTIEQSDGPEVPLIKTKPRKSPFGSLLSRTLPQYSGEYAVGVCDVEVPTARQTFGNFKHKSMPDAAAGLAMDSVLFTLFYPIEQPKKPNPVVWFPSLKQTIDGFLKMAHRTPNIWYRMISYPLAAATVWGTTFPAQANAPLLTPPKKLGKWPVMIFSHGVGCSRLMYSAFCGEMASRGYIVAALEHRDGTSPSSKITSEDGEERMLHWLEWTDLEWPDLDPQPADDTTVRHEQIKLRCAEVEETIKAIQSLTSSNSPLSEEELTAAINAEARHPASDSAKEGHPQTDMAARVAAQQTVCDTTNLMLLGLRAPENMDWRLWEGNVDADEPVMAGHSLGGAVAMEMSSRNEIPLCTLSTVFLIPHNSQARTMPHPDSKKRAFSEIIDDERDVVKSKKAKVESDADPDQSLVLQGSKPKGKGKDGKKRRRRSKSKKQPVTAGASRTRTRSLSMTLEPENGLPAQPEFVQGSSGASSSSISPRAATHQLTPVLAIKSEQETQPSLSKNAMIAERTTDPKGKQPEQAPSPRQSATAPEGTSVPKETLQKVQKQLTTTTETLGTHEALLTALLPSLTCQICLDLLHKPFSLAPCGHVACYSCLCSWFKAPPADQIGAPNAHNVLFRRKTCPHCRAVVRDRPSEVWNIKDMVEGVVKSGLVRDMFADCEPPTEPTAEERAKDPWDKIFHKPSANANHNFGHVPLPPLMLLGQHINAGPHHGVLPGDIPPLHEPRQAHHHDGDRDYELTGMYDEDDDVWRCVDCTHEIWAGICSSCQRVYPENEEYDPEEGDEDDEYDDGAPFHGMLNAMFGGALPGAGHGHGAHDHHDHPDLGLHDDEDLDDGLYEDVFRGESGDEGEDDVDVDDLEGFEARAEFDRDYRQQLHRQLPYIHDLFGVGGDVDVDGDEDGGEGEGGSDGYESSFIDDADAAHHGGERERGIIEISSDSEEDDEVREVRPRLGRRNAPIVVSDDEEEVPPPPYPSSSRRRIVESDEEDEEEIERHRPRAGPSRASPIHSDEEEEDYPFDAAAHGYEEEDDDGSIARPPIHLAHLLHNADSPIPDAREVAERFGEQAGWYEDDEERDDYEDEEPRTDYEDEPPYGHDVERYFDLPAHAMGGGFAEVYPDEHGYDDYYEDGEEDAGEHGGYEYGEDEWGL